MGAKANTVEQAFRQFQVRLQRYIAKRVGDENAAQDVLQEVFLRAQRYEAALAQARTPLAWLYTVTNSAIPDHHRKNSRTPQGRDGALVAPGLDRIEGLERCLTPLIKALPAPYRQALTFTDLEGGRQVDYARAQVRKMVLGCCTVGLDRGNTISTLHPKQQDCC